MHSRKPEIEPIEEYPAPFDKEGIIQMQEKATEGDTPLIRDEDNIEESVDGFHEKYIQELTRTDEWSVFRYWWGGSSNWIYFWNFKSSYGFRADESWEIMCSLTKMMDEFTEEYSPDDFEPTYYPWELP